jgi:hypothetical protein
VEKKEGITMKRYEARNSYKSAVEALVKYCDEKTDLSPVIVDTEYPFRVRFYPDTQTSLFGEDNIDENGEINDLEITVGLTTTVNFILSEDVMFTIGDISDIEDN